MAEVSYKDLSVNGLWKNNPGNRSIAGSVSAAGCHR